jgi:hypothetical protein
MSALNPETLLRVWEQCHGSHPIRRALALLEAAGPAPGDGAWASVPIGRRDIRLLDFHDSLFGLPLQTVARCPHCEGELEADFTASDIRAEAITVPLDGLTLRARGFIIQYRLPNSDDLLAVIALADAPQAKAQLLQRCVICAKRAGRRCAVETLPLEVIDLLIEDMARHDPGADIQIALNCPACRYAWNVNFDIVSYLWSELEEWAQRTLADVHVLARAYGWSEREILGLSSTRRRHYVEMVRA